MSKNPLNSSTAANGVECVPLRATVLACLAAFDSTSGTGSTTRTIRAYGQLSVRLVLTAFPALAPARANAPHMVLSVLWWCVVGGVWLLLVDSLIPQQ